MFTNVIRAIVDLKNDEGVTLKTISEHLRCYIKDPKEQKKDCKFLAQVRRALRHGILSGIVVREGKKYRLELAKKFRQKASEEEPMEIGDEAPAGKPIQSVSEIIDVLPEMQPSGEDKVEKHTKQKHSRRKKEIREKRSNKKLGSRKASNAFCNLSLMLNS